MQIEINGKRNITLDFNAPKNFRLTQNGAEIPYIRTGKNSFRLSKNIDGVVDLEEIIEQPRYMQPVQLQPQQMTVINPQDVERLNEAVRQMALVNPNDVMIINQTAEQLEKNQNFIAQTQKEITDNQVYIDHQQQRLNESALGIQALETNNSQRLDNAETAIYSLAGEIENTKSAVIDGLNATLGKIDQQGIILQAEIDTKADKEELESLKKDIEEKSDRFSSAMASYSGGTAYDTLPQGGEAGQILAKRTDRQGDYIWIDQTPVIVKSETIPTASEKYKGEVYQYVGETGEYTHGYIYECQQNGTSYEWVRLDVQPNTAVWGQITGTLSDQTDLQNALDNKQDKLSQTQIDAVNSGANQSNIAQITTNQANINTINGKIPAQASSENQLADKDFVNSSISTNTANFIGTFASVSDLEGYSGTVTNNDYAFVVNRVVTDNGNDWATFTALNAYDKSLLSNFDYAWVVNGANFDLYRFDIVNQVWELRASNIEKSSVTLNSAYNRYKAVVSGSTTWTYEYTLNNSSFTAGQWQAINSGITSDLVAEFEAKGALLDYTNDVLSLEDSDGNVLSSVTIQASPDIANWSNKITNCITEIPQDIKLELNNGTLTLKAGSKVYVPNGVGVFDTVTTAQDYTVSVGEPTGERTLFFLTNGAFFVANQNLNLYSGTTAPTVSVKNAFWYDTANNAIKRTQNTGSTWDTVTGATLPIAIVTISSGTATSIDQVFNGFGYIGSTAFALPGIKGLIPNGRNKDGSLKNIEYKNTIVRIRTFTWDISGSGQFLALTTTGTASSGTNIPFYQQEEMPPVKPYTYWYKPSENIMYTTGSGTTWYKKDLVVVGRIVGDNTGKITSFTHKTVFHAVDWNDLEDKLNHLNNPFSLLDYKFSEYELSNASWLLSNGQFNSGSVYQSVYNLLLQIYNGTVTKAGVSVKLSTETYADTDFVLNTAGTTFRLPIKVKLASGNAVVGNKLGIGITDGSSDCNITSLVDWNGSDGGGNALKPANKSYGKEVGSGASYDGYSRWGNAKIIGITTDETKSGIETSANGLYLYFYVGEVVQDANIIAAAGVLTDIADLKNASNFSQTGKENIFGFGIPDYTARVSVTTPYTVTEKGWLWFTAQAVGGNNADGWGRGYVNGQQIVNTYVTNWDFITYDSALVPVEVGDVATIDVLRGSCSVMFLPLKGVN